MATQKQIDANIKNAQKSTGPTTAEGKAASRLNAVTHGLTGVLPDCLEEDREQIERVKDRWFRDMKPVGPLQEELVETMALEAIRTSRSRHHFAAVVRKHSERACDQWDIDREAEVEEIAKGLKKNPSRTISLLRKSPHGCAWLIARWELLEEILIEENAWTDEQHEYVLDLLGVDPKLRVSNSNNASQYDTNREMITREIDYLRFQQESAQRHDDFDRELAEKGIGAEFSPSGTRFLRYERMAQRRFDKCYQQMIKLKTEDPSSTTSPADEKALVDFVKPLQDYSKQADEARKLAAILGQSMPPLPMPMPEPKSDPAPPVAQPLQNPKPLSRRERKRLAAKARRAG
jgi:hypothetical protein